MWLEDFNCKFKLELRKKIMRLIKVLTNAFYDL